MVVAAANSVDRRNDWLLDTGSDKTLTHDIEDFHTYQLDHPDTAYAYKDYSGNRVVTLGHGQIIVRTALPGRNGKTHSFMTTGYYTQGGHGKLLGMQKLLEEQDISYDTRTKYLTNGEGDIVGYGDTSTGVPYLVSPKDDDDPNEVKSDIDSDSDDEEIGFVNKVTAYEIHRRLGHAGKARIASTLQHAEQLGDDEQYGTEHFDCDACFQGKSKLKISRQPQARVQDVAWKFHVDTQPMKPTGPNGENYWLPVVDDASRLIEGIMLKNKSDAYYKLTAFCEKIKLLTGRYPGIWRMDGGTEFKEFIKWGEKHGMTFEITPPYTAEPNGTVERFGGHINDIQRTMIIDAKMTEEMWPYATDTAIYIYNRLINPKTKISPLTHWRQELEIPNAEPSLKHLKPWGTTAYVHIPKPKRIQARKAAPRAWKGKLVGYEGDGGHVYKVWDPATRKLVVSRDVGFPQPGDDDNDDTGSMLVNGVPTDPKDPDGDNDVVGFMPVSLTQDDEISKPEIKQRQMVRTLPVQTPTRLTVQAPVTPSTIHLPTIYGSASTMPETPQKTIVPPMRQRKLFQSFLPTVGEEPMMTGARITEITNPPTENVPDVIKQKKEDLGRRLQQLSTQVSQLAESMDDVRRDADNIERSASKESDDLTPSPERQRAVYEYPFSSPIQQASVSPSREIISIQSSPDPISQDPATPAPPPPRRSRRANIGIAPDRYHDPEQKHLAVEYEKRDRDIQRTAKRAKAKESGGNNLTEGDGQGSAGPSAMSATADMTMDKAEMSKVDIDEPFLYNGKPLYAKDVDLPSTYKQAQKSPFWPQWLDAMQRQLGDLVAKNTWSLILKPPKAKILPGQWRFTVKSNTRDEVYEFKARWVVCGNFQDKNDGETYAPVVAECMIKIVFTLIAVYGLRWRQVDFTAAYLNASREDVETVYMRQPTGFEYADAEGDKNQWVCTLNQALFGLRDSAFLWNEEMDCKLRQIGFHPLDDDPCVYVKGKGTELTIMMIHVDDFIIAAPTDEDIEKVVNELRQYYDLKDLGEPKQYLNCALHRDYDNCTITMSQEAYIQKVLRTANAGSGWKDTPLPAAWRESPANASNVLDDDSFDQYQSVVGMLNWLAVKTRPDIRFAVTRLQHRLANPTFEDLHAMQHVVKYLRHMPDVGITLGRTPELRFYAHVDASHADWEDSKSTEGSIWYFAGSPVIWTTKKQTITANSTTVAEWCALDQPTRDAMWLGKIARSFMLPEQRPIEIHTDNINSQLLLTKKGGKSANRWLDLRWFFVKDAVAQGHVDIRRVDTKKNAADGFTKALAKEQFETFVGLIGMI
ncbi:hypothetical protein PDIG_16040 [Penicillium digitatum PHI26]|nr:hypothetical protein PDIG_28890 [Penicillium digitatum PHI26]EKV17274.1 hypothetical protein PDIG_16040 [Penicillium digitatum PHI26]